MVCFYAYINRRQGLTTCPWFDQAENINIAELSVEEIRRVQFDSGYKALSDDKEPQNSPVYEDNQTTQNGKAVEEPTAPNTPERHKPIQKERKKRVDE